MKHLRLAALLSFCATSAFAVDTEITIGQQLEPPHLDPTSAAAGAIDQVLYANVFEGLTRFGADGSINPGLAQSWTISDDGLVYTFALAQGVKFHDGTVMDAQDVKFSLDRARAEDSTNAQKALFEGIADVAVTDPHTVAITLSAPDGKRALKPSRPIPSALARSSSITGSKAIKLNWCATRSIGACLRFWTKRRSNSSRTRPQLLLR